MRLVKFDKSYIYSYLWFDSVEFRLGSWESIAKNLERGPIILSLKDGKRRVLIKGQINISEEITASYGRITSYYFCPKNREKFLKIMGDKP